MMLVLIRRQRSKNSLCLHRNISLHHWTAANGLAENLALELEKLAVELVGTSVQRTILSLNLVLFCLELRSSCLRSCAVSGSSHSISCARVRCLVS